LALAAMAMLLERLLSGRHRRRPPLRRATSSIVERRSTEARARPPLVVSPASTMSAAVEELPLPEKAP
jgi:hypothetical protein